MISGAGLGINNLLSRILPAFHVEKHKTVALSVASMGAATGSLCLPYLLQYLIKRHGWRISMMIVGSIAAQSVVIAAFLRPRNHIYQDAIPKVSLPSKNIVKTFDFGMMCLSFFLLESGGVVTMVVFADYCRERGYNTEEVALLLSVMGCCAMVSRLPTALLQSYIAKHVLLIYTVATLGRGLVLVILPFTYSLWTMLVVWALHGFTLGTYVGLRVCTMIEVFNKKRVTAVMGCLTLPSGAGAIAGPFIAGQ